MRIYLLLPCRGPLLGSPASWSFTSRELAQEHKDRYAPYYDDFEIYQMYLRGTLTLWGIQDLESGELRLAHSDNFNHINAQRLPHTIHTVEI